MRAFLILILLLLPCAASASGVSVEVRTAAGAPVPNAVVSLYPGGRPAPITGASRSFQIGQRDLQFSPFVLVAPVGSQVSFPNFDNVRHHVYSFSPVRRFELRLFARAQSRSILFDRAGIVPVGCNIHDNMIAFVAVSDTALAAKTDAAGRVTFPSVPVGNVTARVWHPYSRAPGGQVELRWAVPRAGTLRQTVALRLRAPPRPDQHY
jgi:plastocyanin